MENSKDRRRNRQRQFRKENRLAENTLYTDTPDKEFLDVWLSNCEITGENPDNEKARKWFGVRLAANELVGTHGDPVAKGITIAAASSNETLYNIPKPFPSWKTVKNVSVVQPTSSTGLDEEE